jgi:hypothetical protein
MFRLQQAVELYEFYQQNIIDCDQQIMARPATSYVSAEKIRKT